MHHWLIKFAPFRYSWDDCLKYGTFEIYSVRNPQARNHLLSMKLNDKVLFYHSQQDRSVMGAMEVVCTAHQDPTTTDPQWISVTFEPTHSLRFPLTLAEIKADPLLQDIGLIRQPRLSVVKIRKSEYERIVLLGEGF